MSGLAVEGRTLVLLLLLGLVTARAVAAASEEVRLPDGTAFGFWEDRTQYARVYHVAQKHSAASDSNPGTADRPFRTINAAAAILQPGEKVTVHEGVYRECVRPARGGEGPDSMIAYEAAPGEEVFVRGSEVWNPEIRPSTGYSNGPVLASGATRWTAKLPPEMFVGYHPFLARNITSQYRRWWVEWFEDETERQLLRRGMIFVDGRPLRQGLWMWDIGREDGTFIVDEDGLRTHFRLWDDSDPREANYEVTVREQVFAPEVANLGYVRVSGFVFEHGAGCLPPPQRGLVSTSQGHHWIIEDNVIRWANGIGLDIGRQTWNIEKYEPSGRHIVRRNTISDCGICGIAGWTGVNGTVVEDNLVERIGSLRLERIWETAGLKFHLPEDVLVRRNVFRHIWDAPGVWFDVLADNCRITGNVFADIRSRRAALYMEDSHDLNLIDGNVFWDIVTADKEGESEEQAKKWGGRGILGDTCDRLVIAYNLFGPCRDDAYPVEFSLLQSNRIVGGRAGLGRRHKVLNNVFVGSRNRIRLARTEENVSDGNLFDADNDRASFAVRYLVPEPFVDLAAWQEYFGFDVHSTQAQIEADFDVETLGLTWKIDGPLPECQLVEVLHEDPRKTPGPFREEQWKRSISGGHGEQWFPDPSGGNPAFSK